MKRVLLADDVTVDQVHTFAYQLDFLVHTIAASRTTRSASPKVAVIVAVTYIGWPRLQALLRRIEKNDADAMVKKNAAIALGALKEHPPE